jgi:exonuclease SbcC
LQDRFDQVIVISHIEGVRDGLDRVISVGFDEQTGAATVTRSDPALAELALRGAGAAAGAAAGTAA